MNLKQVLSASGALIDNRPKTLGDLLIKQGGSLLTPSVTMSKKPSVVKPRNKTIGDLIKEQLALTCK